MKIKILTYIFTGYFTHSGQEIPARIISAMTDTQPITQCITDATAIALRSQNTFSIYHKENFKCAKSSRSSLIFFRKWCKHYSCNKYCSSVFSIYSKGFRSTSANTVLFIFISLTFTLNSKGRILNSDCWNQFSTQVLSMSCLNQLVKF